MGIKSPPGSEASDRVRKAADEWQVTFDSITDLVMILDEEFRIIRLNKSALRFFDLPRERVIGERCFVLMHGTVQPAELCPLTRMIQTKTHEEGELYDAGKGLWLSVSVDPILDEDNNLTGVVHIVKDISDRKKTEKGLIESEAKFRVLAEKSLVGVYLVQDGYFRYVNPCFAKIHGYEVEEILDKKRPRDLPLAEDLPIVEENYRKRITGEAESLRFEFRILTKQQDIKYVEAFGSRTLYQGKPAVIGTLLDITDRKHSEEAIRFERRRFQTLTDNAPFAMVLREEDGRFTYINPLFKQLLGYDLADIPNGEIWYQKAYPDPVYRHNVLACWAEDHKKENPEAKSSREFRVTCKDGTQKEIPIIPKFSWILPDAEDWQINGPTGQAG